MHRDLKPENFFINQDQIVKLGDFGESKSFGKDNFKTAKHTKVGTEFYMSPEILTFKGK